MKKEKRQQILRWLLTQKHIHTQAELMKALKEEGVDATQSTISRDMKELHVTKIRHQNGELYYAMKEGVMLESQFQQLHMMMQENVMSMIRVEFVVIITTALEMANVIAEILDNGLFDEIAGTLAGTNTIVAFCHDQEEAEHLLQKLDKMVNANF